MSPQRGEDFGQLFLDSLKGASRGTSIHQYVPHKKQEAFHSSKATGRIFLGGNRSGKTVGGAIEALYHLRGEHPHKRIPWDLPLRGRGVAVDIEDGLKKIMLPEIAKWIPPSLLVNGSWEDSYDKQSRILYCSNGSIMDFLTYEQDAEKHAGTSRHFIWFDEEPPKHIYNENALRLVDTGGIWWMTMTPLLGLTWIYEQYYRPQFEEHVYNPDVFVLRIDARENPHINPATMELMLQGMSEEEKQARRSGRFIAFAGLIYTNFNEQVHVIEPVNPAYIGSRTVILSLDHGFRHPTAWLFSFLDDEGNLTIFHELYKSEWTVDKHAAYVTEYLEKWGIEPSYFVGDPAIGQRNAKDGTSIHSTYAECGIPILLGNNEVRHGIERVRRRFDEKKLFITSDCVNLIKELRGYRWAQQPKNSKNDSREAPQKHNDHACDSLRYLVVSRPENDTGADPNAYNVRDLLPSYSTGVDGDVYPYEEMEEVERDGFISDILGDSWN